METVTSIDFPSPAAETSDHVDWQYRPGDDVAHAFGSGPGWLRAKCRRIPLTIALLDAPDDMPRCVPCRDEIGAPLTEAESRSLWGDR